MIRRGLTIGVIASLLMALAGGSAVGAAAPGPRLGFLRWGVKPGALELATSDPQGRELEQIVGSGKTLAPDPLSSISWAPAGDMIAFSGETNPGNHVVRPGEEQIFVAPVAGGTPRAVPGTVGGEFPVIAPDGSTMAFVRVHGTDSSWSTSSGEHGRTFAHTSIWLVDMDGTNLHRLTPWRKQGFELPTAFSPDGKMLAATRELGRHEFPSAVALRLDGGGSSVIAKKAIDPVYSPDGSKIAIVGLSEYTYHRKTRGGKAVVGVATTSDLEVIDSDGTGRTRLTHSRAIEETPSWDPSGERLAFVRLSPALTEEALLGVGDAIMEVNADGSCVTKVLSASKIIFLRPVWQPGPGREAGPIAC